LEIYHKIFVLTRFWDLGIDGLFDVGFINSMFDEFGFIFVGVWVGGGEYVSLVRRLMASLVWGSAKCCVIAYSSHFRVV